MTKRKSQMHRHRWNTSGSQSNGTRRVCLDCGIVQRKVAGRWKPA